jgi:CheY-like chemotaxis protein
MRDILLVHDQLESPWPRRHFLESAGYRVSTSASADECLAALARAMPDLLVIDVLIEGLNGFELCRRIRARHGVAELPIVLGSELYRAEVFREEASLVGAQAYLVEPRDLDSLLAAIHHLLAARDADDAQAA